MGRCLQIVGRTRAAALLAFSALLAMACSSAVQEQSSEPIVLPRGQSEYGAVEYVETSLRAGARQGFLLIHAKQPIGSVVLFTGGDGVLNLRPKGDLRKSGNFLMRVRMDFVAAGYNVAAVDTPSDQPNLKFFRTSPGHATDIKGVIAYLRGLAKGPVWLIGTSNGTVSAASVASRLPAGAAGGGPDGIVLTSTVTKSNSTETTVYNSALDAIHVPVLIVSHTADVCFASAMSGSHVLLERMQQTTVTEFVSFSGGSPATSGPCEPFSPHGYFGIEKQVTSAITAWMKAHETR